MSRQFNFFAVCCVVAGLVTLSLGHSLLAKHRPQSAPLRLGDDYGDPLFLTPFIESGDVETGRNRSRVQELEGTGNVTSFSGYLTVNPEFNSNLFFWYFEAQTQDTAALDAPVLVWLEGGPGATSMFSLFAESGPFYVTENMTLEPREFSWHKSFNLIYIDNPAGTGFSFTDSDDGFAKDEDAVAKDLYQFLQQFFTLFPYLRDNDFYVAGESYGGKYVPAIAYKISLENKLASEIINLKGIAIGNGLFEFETQINYGDYLYSAGLLDENGLDAVNALEDITQVQIKNGDWSAAINSLEKLILFNGYDTLIRNLTGLKNPYNILNTVEPKDHFYYDNYLAIPAVRKAIHVGNLTFNSGQTVYEHLREDIPQSVRPWLVSLMEDYKVMVYSGHLDIIIATRLTRDFLETLEWSGAEEFRKTPQQIWKVNETDSEVAGYVRNVKDFSFVVVRNAGHLMMTEQPRAAFDMINNFVYDKEFVN